VLQGGCLLLGLPACLLLTALCRHDEGLMDTPPMLIARLHLLAPPVLLGKGCEMGPLQGVGRKAGTRALQERVGSSPHQHVPEPPCCHWPLVLLKLNCL
jgi:hypothetical protein